MFDFCIDKRIYVRYNNINKNICSEQLFALTEDIMNTATYTMTNRDLLRFKKYLNHKKILRRRFALAILGIFLVLLFVFSLNCLNTEASEELPETTYKYFTYHTVAPGDSLWSMAEEYIDYNFYNNLDEYINEVKEINHLSDSTIKAGENLVVPYFSNIYK